MIVGWPALGKVSQKRGGAGLKKLAVDRFTSPTFQPKNIRTKYFVSPSLRNAIFYLIIYQNKKHNFIQILTIGPYTQSNQESILLRKYLIEYLFF